MYVVTGGAGFIGSNIIRNLNKQSIDEILVVDNLKRSDKFVNLVGLQIADFVDKQTFRDRLHSNAFGSTVEAINHQGACSDTMEYDGQYMMDNNYTYSKDMLHYALDRAIPFVYASSAAVYGNSGNFTEVADNELPLNIYGYSKLLFDRYVRRLLHDAQSTVVGLRYFNVYGPGEAHKGRMASVVYQLHQQLKKSGTIRLFEGTDGYANGEQRRDFIYVDDVSAINLHFLNAPATHEILNVGSGASRSFNDIAHALINMAGEGRIEYIPFPETLRGKYQSFTQADISKLRTAGIKELFTPLESGVSHYYRFLETAQIR